MRPRLIRKLRSACSPRLTSREKSDGPVLSYGTPPNRQMSSPLLVDSGGSAVLSICLLYDLNAHSVFTGLVNRQIEPIEFTSSRGRSHVDHGENKRLRFATEFNLDFRVVSSKGRVAGSVAPWWGWPHDNCLPACKHSQSSNFGQRPRSARLVGHDDYMNIYLPVAEMPANVYLFLAMGASIGFLSGLFGVGGGFLMTPLLIFSGVPPAIAVGTESAQIVASSASGALAHWRRKNIDMEMGAVLLAGGIFGSIGGVQLVAELRKVGAFDFFVSICYVTFLGVIGTLMLIESANSIRKTRQGAISVTRRSVSTIGSMDCR